MEPNYLLDFKGLVSVAFGPQTPIGGCGRGDFPPTIVTRGDPRGREQLMDSPLVGVWGKHPRKEFFLEKCLVKYYNFVVNLSRSLCHRPNSRSYVNLGIFALEDNPLLYMRELHYDYVLFL